MDQDLPISGYLICYVHSDLYLWFSVHQGLVYLMNDWIKNVFHAWIQTMHTKHTTNKDKNQTNLSKFPDLKISNQANINFIANKFWKN